jgi:hypothetical protein
MPLKTEIRKVRLGDLRPQKVNARYMTGAQMQQLVDNIKHDGTLTSVPLAYQARGKGPIDLLSGHHRVKAAIEALGEDTEVDVMVVLDKQSLAEIRARQISHNSIAGQDDLATLKQLFDEIDDVDWRQYAGLDDKTMALLEEVDLASLGEANLDFLAVQFLFLPHERDRAVMVLDTITSMARVDERFIAAEDQWGRLIDSLDTARGAANVVNSAAAFTVLLDLVEANLGQLSAGWFREEDGSTRHDKWVPVETILGARSMPAEAAAVILQAMNKARRDAELENDAPPWRAAELLAADYLAGA